uniref:Uncharacterized protein n=1 Tax=Rhizophora mucronata TaxID=61149 RepID=A0A2P2INV2_RHIMU
MSFSYPLTTWLGTHSLVACTPFPFFVFILAEVLSC